MLCSTNNKYNCLVLVQKKIAIYHIWKSSIWNLVLQGYYYDKCCWYGYLSLLFQIRTLNEVGNAITILHNFGKTYDIHSISFLSIFLLKILYICRRLHIRSYFPHYAKLVSKKKRWGINFAYQIAVSYLFILYKNRHSSFFNGFRSYT